MTCVHVTMIVLFVLLHVLIHTMYTVPAHFLLLSSFFMFIVMSVYTVEWEILKGSSFVDMLSLLFHRLIFCGCMHLRPLWNCKNWTPWNFLLYSSLVENYMTLLFWIFEPLLFLVMNNSVWPMHSFITGCNIIAHFEDMKWIFPQKSNWSDH